MVAQLAKIYGRSRIPLYLQVAATLRRRVETGRWEPGGKFPTLEVLESEFQVARVTVRQAVDLLEAEGLVHRRQGKGTFVAKGLKDKRWLKLGVEWSSLIDTIKDNVPRFIPTPDPPRQPRLDPGEGKPVDAYRYLCSVQSKEGEPYAYAGVHLASRIFDLSPEAFRSRTALPILATLEAVTIAHAHQTLVIGSADTETAQHLKVPLNSPTAEAHCVVVDGEGFAIYVGEIVYRGDCVKLDIDLLDNAAP